VIGEEASNAIAHLEKIQAKELKAFHLIKNHNTG